ncbi:hypothetical protein Premu_2011 [Hallella multisaccharivorax DSM 17128]|uniref:DUF4301 domain-containing protein n=1 Tax=Hallella multisaccharivorax DSM 17128 TaxID=688246 RepID=F8N793_9BACT|nr:DUF4301 family protein [Hallella multisaccharivorax]EGN57409.1 hypothetical protein Premu_2011 [Hallella multisaccharivorax DSM 17128]
MLTQQDKQQIEGRGMTIAQVEHQLREIEQGFPFLKLEAAAAVGKGITVEDGKGQKAAMDKWQAYKDAGHKIVKFVPASGAASRMFKNMFAFLNADYDVPQTDFEKEFFTHIRHFAFYDALNAKCLENNGKDIPALIKESDYKVVVANLLNKEGLNYGQLPKGLLLFHRYDDGVRTPMEEHLVEAALYAGSKGEAHIHYTVSHDHLQLFEQKVEEKKDAYEKKYGVRYDISFSEQKPSTDTIAANPDNTPFRNDDGTLLFRPGGHGALIENLNDIDADVVFIKNIDNVVPDRLKADTVRWKQVIGGVLVDVQEKIFDYLRVLDSGVYNHTKVEEIIRFVQQVLCCRRADLKQLEDGDLVPYLRKKLNRPLRVCGVVRNVGEPGGGPFLAYNQDGTVSPQILESSQIDMSNNKYVEMFTSSTHFNPVDLVCAIKNYKGEHFDLPKYVDAQTGFISSKSKNGKALKALELPGLWNGAMSDWNTVFVEVPLTTFNPVKTVNDLLRDTHQ